MHSAFNKLVSDYECMEDYTGNTEEDEFGSADYLELEDYDPNSADLNVAPSLINNQDYTLNSPLISDELNAFKEFVISGKVNKLYYNPSWLIRKKWLSSAKINVSSISSTTEYHRYCASLWIKDQIETRDFRDLIVQSDDHSRKTYAIVESYFKEWIGKTYLFKSRKTNNLDIEKYGAYMLEALKLTWILNSSTLNETTQLLKSLNCVFLNNDPRTECVSYTSCVFGEVLIGQGIIYFKKDNQLWDRNMLLMFKDTSTARFHTLFAIKHRPTDLYHEDHLKTITELYRLGDKLLYKDSKKAYEAFALIEPKSSLKLSEVARSFRPEIPQFPHFHQYLREKTAEITESLPESLEFFELIDTVDDRRILLTIYGSFRHWGHPFIEYLEGLAALHKNVTSTEDTIDEGYANVLASDLAQKILKREFQKTGKWYVDPELMADDDPLKNHVIESTWPSSDVINAYPEIWHLLPLTKCWEIPEVIDPSIIYSDKTHSIDRDELINHLNNHPYSQIPTRKVLETLIKTPSTNWPVFLQRINDEGLTEKELIIGLKAKEREIKRKGRFFALMSWQLREYFVLTEYLIKQKIIPLFSGLTMADDQTTLTKKLLMNTKGQGDKGYENITISNHFDYEKWNNYQRLEATEPVFSVIGKFFGLPKLFSRTHEFFQKSLIYYRDRPDLMEVRDGIVLNKFDDIRVCWNGQLGGLEGLRQKGWSVLNLLVIERQSAIRNTSVKILAQGDNQVICTQYQMQPTNNEILLRQNIADIIQNNNIIIASIRDATKRIGLRINENETLQSADLLLYGKVIVFRGNINCLEEKRYSRITCTTNDQLPSLVNVMATVSTNSLTVAHYSKSPVNAIINYNWLSNFVINILNIHNPALRKRPEDFEKLKGCMDNTYYRVGLIYLDPSLGGISGMSLTRFQLRMFPDPVTESLSFWKIIYKGANTKDLKQLSVAFGNPKPLNYLPVHFEKLIEDPTSLNLPKGISAQNVIKSEIKRSLLNSNNLIQNEIIENAISHVRTNEGTFHDFLSGIEPCFPRFLSEFKSSTYFGMTSSIIGLFENSKTIRNLFKRKFKEEVDAVIVKCEYSALLSIKRRSVLSQKSIWDCSSSQADHLRSESWNRVIIGMTVPHPSELLANVTDGSDICESCNLPIPFSIKLIASIPKGIVDPENHRGELAPYLGSSTNEYTSLIQAWEKDTDISFIKKASNLRRALHWFVEHDSLLGQSIIQNLHSLTGQDPGGLILGFKRTGSALHRFGCSRISSGGFTANNTVYGSRMYLSTDHFNLLGDENYDFMYQSNMIYAQQTSGEIHGETEQYGLYHYHISCLGCLRKIEEPILEADREFRFEDVSEQLIKWKPENSPWFKETQPVVIPVGAWSNLNRAEMSREVGLVQGVIYGCFLDFDSESSLIKNLFPETLKRKVLGDEYIFGLIDGLYRAASVSALQRSSFMHSRSVSPLIESNYIHLITRLTSDAKFITFARAPQIIEVFNSYPHRIPPSYPSSDHDVGQIVYSMLKTVSYHTWRERSFNKIPKLWVFADVHVPSLSSVLIVAYELSIALSEKDTRNMKLRARNLKDVLISVRSQKVTGGVQNLVSQNKNIMLCPSELRHAVKHSDLSDQVSIERKEVSLSFDNKVPFNNYWTIVEYSTEEEPTPELVIPRIQNPIISGIRTPQIATGSFLKMQLILESLKLKPLDIICGGDGSGGISALLLRTYKTSRLIFNSLIDLQNINLNGVLPGPPSAIDQMSENVKRRCVNLNCAWESSMDLSKLSTWLSFSKLKRKNDLKLNLLVLDMEIQSEESIDEIDELARQFIGLFEDSVVCIIKSYVHRITSKKSILTVLGTLFHEVILFQNDLSSSQTSEVYIVFKTLKRDPKIQTYPRFTRLRQYLDRCFCFRSYSEEFNRARRIMYHNFTKGIPKIFLPDPKYELFGIWNLLTVDKVKLNIWMNHFESCRATLPNYAFMTLAFISNQVINTTRWSKYTSLEVPSDGKLSKFFSIYIGTYLYIALVNNCPTTALKVQNLIDNDFTIYFSETPIRKDKETMFYNKWSLRPIKCRTSKVVSVKSHLSLIGSVIRYLLATSKLADKIHARHWNQSIQELSKGLTLNVVMDSTDMFYGFL